jgi:hypothetical protein
MTAYLLLGTACMIWGHMAGGFLALILVRSDGTRRAAANEPLNPHVLARGIEIPVLGSVEVGRYSDSWLRDGLVCGLFAVDIAGFTDHRRDEHVQLYLRERLYRMLERAFDGAGVPWQACYREDRGDGALIVVPPGISVDALADPLPERLSGLVRVHNRVSSNEACIQLRVAVHVGKVYRDAYGLAGDATTHLCRLLDASRLKHLLAASGSELAFIASDYFYDTVIRRHPTLVDPVEFQPVTVDLKRSQATGWVQLLTAPSQRPCTGRIEKSCPVCHSSTGRCRLRVP